MNVITGWIYYFFTIFRMIYSISNLTYQFKNYILKNTVTFDFKSIDASDVKRSYLCNNSKWKKYATKKVWTHDTEKDISVP